MSKRENIFNTSTATFYLILIFMYIVRAYVTDITVTSITIEYNHPFLRKTQRCLPIYTGTKHTVRALQSR